MSQTKVRADVSPAPATPGHEGQTFLVGDLVYLRGFEISDGKYVTSWRDSAFPVSTERGEQIVKEDLAREYRARTLSLVVTRKTDDRVVGSVTCHFELVAVSVSVHVDPLVNGAGALKADAIATVMPWVVDENQRTSAHLELGADEEEAIAGAKRVGMRQTARFREALLRQGERVDSLHFDYLNARWVEMLGDPADVLLERTGTGQPRPVPAKGVVAGDPPPHALLIGERVYLRPYQKADTEVIARAAMRETEPIWSNGRFPRSSVMLNTLVAEQEKADIPRDYWFAVCLRENDEYIGQVGIINIDPINRTAETGSEIVNPAHRGGGYGSEAKHLLLEHCFDRLGLHMVRSSVAFQNTRSAAALRKQGYTEAGRVHWIRPMGGGFRSSVVFDLLAREWRAMPRDAR